MEVPVDLGALLKDATGEAPAVVSAPPDPLPPLLLPEAGADRLRELAAETGVLIFGETHGTREVPRMLAGLLPLLEPLGYRGLAFEADADQRDGLEEWARGEAETAPPFWASPSFDGRGNAESLALAREAARAGWRLLCFDLAPGQPAGEGWAGRDAAMAGNLVEQRRRLCLDGRVLAVCGNMHSRLTRRSQPGEWGYDLWPSFAAALQAAQPELAVRSVNVRFGRGTYYNVAVRTLHGGDAGAADVEARVSDDLRGEHSLELRLPECTAASFLAAPPALPGGAG